MTRLNAGRGAVLVTGGTSGIGLGIAEALVRSGRPVVLIGRSQVRCAAADDLLSAIADAEVLTESADTCDEATLTDVVDRATRRWGAVDGLVTSAGRLARGGLLDLEPDNFRSALEANVMGTWLAIRAVAPAMIARRHGRIVTIGSVLGTVGAPQRAGYSATKGAVAALTRSLALELAPHNVTINCVAPGPVRTPMNTGSAAAAGFYDMIPVGRWGTPADIAQVTLPLLHAASGFVTGSTIHVDGGYTSR